mgnify:CR=1 FL=1
MEDAVRPTGPFDPQLPVLAFERTGGGLETVVLNVAVLAVYAAVVMALAAWRFRKAISG